MTHFAAEVVKGCGTGALLDVPEGLPVKGDGGQLRGHSSQCLVGQQLVLKGKEGDDSLYHHHQNSVYHHVFT